MDNDHAARLREEAEKLTAYIRSIREHVRSQSDPFAGRGFTVEDQMIELSKLIIHVGASVSRCAIETAEALEARAG